ncbi:MAG: hypothetical protein U1A78_30345 [Polyangia bacterium]
MWTKWLWAGARRPLVAAALVGAVLGGAGAADAKKAVEAAPAGSAVPVQSEQQTTRFRIVQGGFEVVDPDGKVRRRLEVPGKIYDLLYFNRTLWVARGALGVTPYDVTDPTNPRELNTFAKGRVAVRLASHQKSLLVIVADYVTTTYDIANLDEPMPVPPDTGHSKDKAGGPAVDSEKLRFRPGGRGLEAVRMAGPAGGAEKVIADVPLMGEVLDVVRIGNALFVARGGAGVTAFDIADPTNPRRRGTFGQGRPAVRVAEQDGRLMVIVADHTTLAFDVSDPARPAPMVLVEQNSTVSLLGPLYNIPDPPEPPPAPKVVEVVAPLYPLQIKQLETQLEAEKEARADSEKRAKSRRWLWAGIGVLVGGAVAAGVATAVALAPKTGPAPEVPVTPVEF